jgi:hypothetical protein
MLRVVGVGDGKAATRLKVADPEVPGRVGTSLWSFPGDHADAGGRARPRAGDRGLRSAGSEDAFEAVRRGGTISLRLVAG